MEGKLKGDNEKLFNKISKDQRAMGSQLDKLMQLVASGGGGGGGGRGESPGRPAGLIDRGSNGDARESFTGRPRTVKRRGSRRDSFKGAEQVRQ